MLEKLRGPFKPIVEALARPLKGIDPNIITIIGFLLGFVPVYLFIKGNTLLAGLSIFLYLFDSIDGALARLSGRVTKFGAVLDSTFDRIVDASLILSIAIGGFVSWELSGVVLIGSFLVSYIRARVEGASNNSFKMDVGIAQRGDRIFLIAIGAIFYFEDVFFDLNSLEIIFALLAILSWITVIWRLFYAYKKFPPGADQPLAGKN